jgi:hypothetical protein
LTSSHFQGFCMICPILTELASHLTPWRVVFGWKFIGRSKVSRPKFLLFFFFRFRFTD